jgi:hypothetical protein
MTVYLIDSKPSANGWFCLSGSFSMRLSNPKSFDVICHDMQHSLTQMAIRCIDKRKNMSTGRTADDTLQLGHMIAFNH